MSRKFDSSRSSPQIPPESAAIAWTESAAGAQRPRTGPATSMADQPTRVGFAPLMPPPSIPQSAQDGGRSRGPDGSSPRAPLRGALGTPLPTLPNTPMPTLTNRYPALTRHDLPQPHRSQHGATAAELGTTNSTLATKEWHFSLEEGLQAEPPRVGRAATGPVVITARERARLEAFVPDDVEPEQPPKAKRKNEKTSRSALRGGLLVGGLLAALALLAASSPRALGRVLSTVRVAADSTPPMAAPPDRDGAQSAPVSQLEQAVATAAPVEAPPVPPTTLREPTGTPTATQEPNAVDESTPPPMEDVPDDSAERASKVGSEARAVDHLAKGELRKARIEYAILAHENPHAEVYKTLHRLLSERVKQACRYSADPQRCEDGP